jgi:thiol-disulfide isomerase/thioredoxin
MRVNRVAASFVLLLVASVVAVLNGTAAGGRLALVAGDQAPVTRGNQWGGGYYIADYSARDLTVVNFWATWCEPCRKEMGELQKFYEQREDDRMEIVGVHVGHFEQKEFEAFFEAIPVDYTILTTTDRWLASWGGLSILPRTYLVDRDGRIIRYYVGASPQQVEAMLYDIQAYLDGRPLGPVVIPESPEISTPADGSRQAKSADEEEGSSER